VNGERVNFYSFGMTPNGPIPIYVIKNSDGDQVGHNVIDYIQGSDGYSDLWEVYLYVDEDDEYEANSIKNADDLTDKFDFEKQDDFIVNCPVVNDDDVDLDGDETDADAGAHVTVSIATLIATFVAFLP